MSELLWHKHETLDYNKIMISQYLSYNKQIIQNLNLSEDWYREVYRQIAELWQKRSWTGSAVIKQFIHQLNLSEDRYREEYRQIVELLQEKGMERISTKILGFLYLFRSTLKDMKLKKPAIYVDEEEEEIEFLWENDQYRLLINFDWDFQNGITILRIKKKEKEDIIELEAKMYDMIRYIRGLVLSRS